jgi:peroxiredoxin
MTHRRTVRLTALALFLLSTLPTGTRSDARGAGGAQSRPPDVGDKAPDFTLRAIDGTPVTLSSELARGPVVLVLLRGWPGYHCPFCVRQFGEFLGRQKDFAARGVRVLWIYPAATASDVHADAFVANKDVPALFRLLVDPGFVFTNQYGLRWEGPGETSYPSTFVLDRTGVVRFGHVSRVHGGRTPVAEVLAALDRLTAP